MYVKHILDLANYTITLSPNNTQTYWSFATYYLRIGDMQGTYDKLQKAISLDSTNPNSWQIMLSFVKNTGTKELYEKLLNEAKSNIPGFDVLDK